MNTKLCSVCGAKWIDGQHYWSGTAKKGNELDLAGLVCNNLPEDKRKNCANPCLGKDGGQTWAQRINKTENALKEFDL